MRRSELSAAAARRIALAAQGFDRPRPRGRVGPRQVREVVRRLGLLQLDYVNVLVPAHYQVLFSRLGPYDRSLLDDLLYRRRELTEQWAREASIVPVELWPLLVQSLDPGHRRVRALERFLEGHRGYADRVLAEVRARGPVTAAELPEPDGAKKGKRDFWGWTPPKVALEALFVRGDLAVADRRSNFARVFDLAERVIPRKHFSRRISREEAQRELLHRAARALGVATAGDLADVYRMPVRDTRRRLDELAEAGRLRRVRVEGWRDGAYLHPQARAPRRIAARALLSPFDPVVWNRARVQRLFGVDYRLEIWVPRAKRKWGYYVLPFLLGDRLVARVDLKADRTEGRLLVIAAYLEAGAKPGRVAETLAAELVMLAGWLGLDSVSVGRRGDLARPLAAAVGR